MCDPPGDRQLCAGSTWRGRKRGPGAPMSSPGDGRMSGGSDFCVKRPLKVITMLSQSSEGTQRSSFDYQNVKN